jgi:hypothetical protein
MRKYGNAWTSPCPSLQQVGDQFFCGEFKNSGEAEEISIGVGGIGSGCSSPLFNDERNAIRKRLVKEQVQPASKDSTDK